jgi:serine protease Do
VDTNGNVMGINTLILSQSGGSEGLGFAAPSNIVKNVYEQIKTQGRVRRGQIGVVAQTINPIMAAGLGLPQKWGVLAGDVIPGSPASLAGIKTGDIIFSLNGKLMENGRQFDVNLYKYKIGEQVNIEIVRGAERKVLQVEVVERADDFDQFVDLANPQENLIPRLGILAIDINRRVEEMLPGLRKRFGVLVAAISADTPIAYDLLRPGDVIYSINNTEVTGISGLRAELDKLNAGDAVVLHLQRSRKLMYLALELER